MDLSTGNVCRQDGSREKSDLPSFLGEWVWDSETSLLLSTKTIEKKIERKKKKPLGFCVPNHFKRTKLSFFVFIVVMSFFPVAIFLNRMKEDGFIGSIFSAGIRVGLI